MLRYLRRHADAALLFISMPPRDVVYATTMASPCRRFRHFAFRHAAACHYAFHTAADTLMPLPPLMLLAFTRC